MNTAHASVKDYHYFSTDISAIKRATLSVLKIPEFPTEALARLSGASRISLQKLGMLLRI
jgi:hypothetical protein